MPKLKKLAVAAAAVGALAAVPPASAVIVGGIDFGPLGEFSHIETATIAQSFVAGAGNVLNAYGLIPTVNGDSTYCADGSSNCALYFISTSVVSATAGADLYFGDTQLSIFYSPAASVNLLGQNSAANLAFIGSLTRWATLRGENGVDPTANGLVGSVKQTQTLTGASVSSTGSGLLSVNTTDGLGDASVEAFLNANAIATFTGAFADIAFTSSANNFVLNPFDLAATLGDSCLTSAPQVGDWCLAGSADFRGRTAPVPLPATLPLFGLGLLVVGAARRVTKKR